MKNNIDSIITFILLKKLINPITSTDAYKFKLIDKQGKVIRVPKTDKEKDALTILDRFVYKLKRLLGSKLINLNKFLYLRTLNTNMYDKLNIKGNVEQRAEILRLNKDINNLQEKYSKPLEELLILKLHEDLQEELLNEV